MSRNVPGWLSEEGFDTETLLDVSVNLVPMAILAFFVGVSLLFAFVFRPYPYDPFATVISHGLTILPFVFLGIMTYASAKVLSADDDGAPAYETTPSDAELDSGGEPLDAVEREAAPGAPDAPDIGARVPDSETRGSDGDGDGDTSGDDGGER